MNNTISLIILAAGLGSRYGGLKQIDQVGPSGETILDYTIHDAIEVGFRKIIFVINKDHESIFKNLFLKQKLSNIIIEFVYQNLEDLPESYVVPLGRTKPWGTAHAVLMTKDKINEPFAIVNADDFYGRSSLKLVFDSLCQMNKTQLLACLIGFKLKNTLSDNGSVSRGICQIDNSGNLNEIVERTDIAKTDNQVFYEENGERTLFSGNEITSMNLMGFTPVIFDLIENKFTEFLDYNIKTNDLKEEYFIPTVLEEVRKSGVSVPVINSHEQWFGVTYKEDKNMVIEKLKELVEKGIYPQYLW